MEEPIDHPAVWALRAFLDARSEWECRVSDHYRTIPWGHACEKQLEADRATQRAELEAVYAKHCEAGLKARRLRDKGFSFTPREPGDDASDEVITSVKVAKGKVVVETRQGTGARWLFRYEVVERDGAWLVRDNRKLASDRDPSWQPDLL